MGKKNPIAVFETTMGSFELEIFIDQMPITGSNFIDLVNQGFYNDLHFHRVVRDFVVQFGCPFSIDAKSKKAGTGGPKKNTQYEILGGQNKGKFETRDQEGNIVDEFHEKISNEPGTISMANTGEVNTGGSQFFINVAHNTSLDWFETDTDNKHPVFGKVSKGYDIVEAMNKVEITPNDLPKNPIKVNKVTMAEK